MRVTNQLLNTISLQGMYESNNKMLTIVEQGNTGLWINRPSDAPIQYSFARAYDKQLAINQQYNANNAIAQGWLERQSISLSNFTTSLTRIATLAEEAASGNTSIDQLNTIAFQLRQEIKELVSITNVQFNGNSIYAGTNFDSPAFELKNGLDTTLKGITWAGDPERSVHLTVAPGTNTTIPSQNDITFTQTMLDGTVQDIILPAGATTLTLQDNTTITFTDATQVIAGGDTITIRPTVYYLGSQHVDNSFGIEVMEHNTLIVNGTGDTIFGGVNPDTNTATLSEDTNAFEIVGKLIAAVEKHDYSAIQDLLDPIQKAVQHITNYQANIGGKQNYLKSAKNLVEESTNITKNTLSDLQDINITDVLAESKNLEVQYSLSVTIYAKIHAMNILQYL